MSGHKMRVINFPKRVRQRLESALLAVEELTRRDVLERDDRIVLHRVRESVRGLLALEGKRIGERIDIGYWW